MSIESILDLVGDYEGQNALERVKRGWDQPFPLEF